jgi:hypothetical protein
MRNNTQSVDLSEVKQSKDTSFKNQSRIYFNYLNDHIATNSMAAAAIGISQKNLCRFKRELQLTGKLFEVRKSFCEVTGHRAMYLTTNKNLL